MQEDAAVEARLDEPQDVVAAAGRDDQVLDGRTGGAHHVAEGRTRLRAGEGLVLGGGAGQLGGLGGGGLVIPDG